jgi:hypothetical protein
MSNTYIKDNSGNDLLATNTITDDTGSSQTANTHLLDDIGTSIQVFFTRYPTSLLEGSKRRFKAYFPRTFLGTGKSRVFKA